MWQRSNDAASNARGARCGSLEGSIPDKSPNENENENEKSRFAKRRRSRARINCLAILPELSFRRNALALWSPGQKSALLDARWKSEPVEQRQCRQRNDSKEQQVKKAKSGGKEYRK